MISTEACPDTQVDRQTESHTELDRKSKTRNVYLFVPNVIGYFRLGLLALSWTCHGLSRPSLALALYIVSATLDFFDGVAARQLGQTSVFGAWLDVMIDVVGRTMMWNMISCPSSFPWGQMVATLEWLAFVCNHAVHGSRWKSRMVQQGEALTPPMWVSLVFANGFKSPLGVIVIGGIHILPPWLYLTSATHNFVLWPLFQYVLQAELLVTPMLVAARVYAALVELWVIWDHIQLLANLKDD